MTDSQPEAVELLSNLRAFCESRRYNLELQTNEHKENFNEPV
jgi:hypothetical protein